MLNQERRSGAFALDRFYYSEERANKCVRESETTLVVVRRRSRRRRTTTTVERCGPCGVVRAYANN